MIVPVSKSREAVRHARGICLSDRNTFLSEFSRKKGTRDGSGVITIYL
jgi:pantothenate synthetase